MIKKFISKIKLYIAIYNIKKRLVLAFTNSNYIYAGDIINFCCIVSTFMHNSIKDVNITIYDKYRYGGNTFIVIEIDNREYILRVFKNDSDYIIDIEVNTILSSNIRGNRNILNKKFEFKTRIDFDTLLDKSEYEDTKNDIEAISKRLRQDFLYIINKYIDWRHFYETEKERNSNRIV